MTEICFMLTLSPPMRLSKNYQFTTLRQASHQEGHSLLQLSQLFHTKQWGRTRKGQAGTEGDRIGTEGGRERGTKVGALKGWELGEVVGKGTMQQCSIFCSLKRAKGRRPRKKRWKLGLQGRGDGRCGPPCPPLPATEMNQNCKIRSLG